MLRKCFVALAVVGAIGLGVGSASSAAADHCRYGGYYYGGPSYHRSYYGGYGHGYYGPSYRHVHYHGYSPYSHGYHGYHGHRGHGYGHGHSGVSVSIGF